MITNINDVLMFCIYNWCEESNNSLNIDKRLNKKSSSKHVLKCYNKSFFVSVTYGTAFAVWLRKPIIMCN